MVIVAQECESIECHRTAHLKYDQNGEFYVMFIAMKQNF